MALNKSVLNVNFAQGLDLKTDPFQVQPGRFLSLSNSIFDKAGRLTKRNGYGQLTALPDSSTKFLTTFNGDLTAIGDNLQAYSSSNRTWVNKGHLQPVSVNTLPLIRSNTNQSQADTAVASNGLVCTVFTDNTPSAVYKYVIADSVTGQNIVAPTPIPVVSGVVTGSPRVFLLGPYFIIVFTNVITATSHLQYIAISIANPTLATTAADITSSYVSSPGLSWDGVVVNSNLYIAYNTTTGGQSVKVTYLSSALVVVTAVTFAGSIATLMSMTADMTTPSAPIIWASFYDDASNTGYVLAVDKLLNTILTPTQIIATGDFRNITASAQNAVLTVLAEKKGTYAYDAAIETDLIVTNTVTQAGVVGTPSTLIRSVGLASKAFLLDGASYFLAIYNSIYQPSYFLINGSGKIIAKLAYSNGAASYYNVGLPNISFIDSVAYLPYLIKDSIQSVNKVMNAASTTGVYSQTGINLVAFNLGVETITSVEIGQNLNLTGGFLAMYDGYSIVENGFFVWPDYVEVVGSTTGGTMTAQQYFYQVTYEWSDNQGNVFRSAPSIPVSVTTTGSTSSVVVNVPTLRLTYKTQNPTKIVIYRWSAGQQTFYQVTSITSPILNDISVDSIAFTDTLPDSLIVGNNILYTTGGVLENISAPATDLITLFDNRLFLLDSENRNLLWFSKQVIQQTPVEMSDLLTVFIAPTTASQGSTGYITAMSPMDDKLIIFKPNALGYINGRGPDNTGAQNQYSDFTLINSVVGCQNQQSIVFTPSGLMFQSNKGIWLLGRGLSTEYIGAPVESLTTGAIVQSAVNIPATNQVRFTLDTGITLMYDYFFQQWGTFINVPAVSSTLYNSLHTYVNSLGKVYQESPGLYLDGANPVLMSFTTSWMNLAGVQGYERFYQMYMLGQYLSPFKLNVQLAYDYNSSILQSVIVMPNAPGGVYGADQLWGSNSLWGGPSNVFEARVFPQVQKCESFQITVNEIYDSTLGVQAGAGLTLSGLNIVAGIKKGFRTSTASRSFG